jgi:hypothetical protein
MKVELYSKKEIDADLKKDKKKVYKGLKTISKPFEMGFKSTKRGVNKFATWNKK